MEQEIDITGKLLMALIELNMYISMNAKGDNCVPGSDLQKGCSIITLSRQFNKALEITTEALIELTSTKENETNGKS
jgi:hypothetical protein